MFTQFCILISCTLLVTGTFTAFEPRPLLDGRIVGGFPIDITQVPWQASMQKSGRHSCGASILSNKWLLTAAHCVQGARSVTVRIGTNQYAQGGTVYKVKNMIAHEKFKRSTIDWDYALLELEDSIEFSDTVQPIKLIDTKQKVIDNTMALVTGWGNTQNSSESNQILRGVEVPVVNQKKCRDAYMRTGFITPRMLCAGVVDKGGKDSCQGDSGGPMIVYDAFKENPVQIGIVSWGYGCAKKGFPGVYSRVTVARDWILKHTGI